MEFTIGQNSSLPLLKLQVVKDGIADYQSMMSFIETSSIFFSMIDSETGVLKINSEAASFVEKIEMNPNASPEFYVYYRFTPQDTSKPGRYEGQFVFINETGTLVLPIREKLYINVVESYLSNSLPYDNCYVLDYNCCVTPFPTPTPTPTNYPELSQTPTPTPTNTPTNTPTPSPSPNDFVVLDIPEGDLNYGLVITNLDAIDIPENDLNYGLVITNLDAIDIPENDLNFGLLIN